MSGERLKKTVTRLDLDRILADPRTKVFGDLRDRAAHMHLTGGFPSHLRDFFTGALRVISSDPQETAQATSSTCPSGIAKDVVEKLNLDCHPMVLAVRRRSKEGWQIKPSLGPDRRRPFTKVFMFCGDQRITVQIDGSVLDHWPLLRPTRGLRHSSPAQVRTRQRPDRSPQARMQVATGCSITTSLPVR